MKGEIMRRLVFTGVLILSLVIIGVGACSENETTYTDLSAAEAKNLIEDNLGVIIIDVSPDWENGRLPEAAHYYLGDGSLDAGIANLDMSDTYLVYCHADAPSMQGAQDLIDAGFEDVYRLEGNYSAWVDAGYDIEENATDTYTDITPVQARAQIDSYANLVVIDVSPDYDAGHLPGAVHYYLGDGSLDAAIPGLDMNNTYLVYCHADAPSIQGAQKLIDAGFEDVYRLEGNYGAWVDAGYDIET
jgi:rhodanese-related sulfurtransferase